MGADKIEDMGINLYTVSACMECNTLLGDRSLLTTDDRVGYVYGAIQKKYKRILKAPEWDDDEVDELDGSLQVYIETQNMLRSWVERRLQYIEQVHFDIV
jgi:hypothetical protein